MVFSGPLEGFPAWINSSTADRAADQKPCREGKGAKVAGYFKKVLQEAVGTVLRRNISRPHWTCAIKTVTWNARVTQRFTHEKK